MKTSLIPAALLLLAACAGDRLTGVDLVAAPKYLGPDAANPPAIYIDGKESTVAAVRLLKGDAVESVEVVKGPTAISRFGSRGVRGVIVVVTKGGASGTR
jgi:outer membrane receptor for monomeric catechols